MPRYCDSSAVMKWISLDQQKWIIDLFKPVTSFLRALVKTFLLRGKIIKQILVISIFMYIIQIIYIIHLQIIINKKDTILFTYILYYFLYTIHIHIILFSVDFRLGCRSVEQQFLVAYKWNLRRLHSLIIKPLTHFYKHSVVLQGFLGRQLLISNVQSLKLLYAAHFWLGSYVKVSNGT